MSQAHEESAAACAALAERLRAAADHADIAARHFRDTEVPRACAHLWAAQGETVLATQALAALAITHAGKSRRV